MRARFFEAIEKRPVRISPSTFQGDVRVLLLMAYTRAKLRAGYGDTGGSYLLTHRASVGREKELVLAKP